MAKTYHCDTVVEERLSKDEKVEIRVHSDLRKDRQHRHRINCHRDDCVCTDGADDADDSDDAYDADADADSADNDGADKHNL